MKKFGNKPMTGEQVRWGFEHLDLTADRIKELGFEGMIAAAQGLTATTTRARDVARVQQWDGKEWKIISDYYTGGRHDPRADGQGRGRKYAEEKKITPRDCSKES